MKLDLRKKIFLIINILFVFLISSYAFSSDEDSKSNTVYLVIANRLSLQDINKMDNLNAIIRDGSIGLMNTRGVSGYTGPESYITINASSKAFADYNSSGFFNLNEQISEILLRRTGHIYKDYEIANIDIYKLLNINKDNTYNSAIGALGDNLHNSGLKTAVLGNSDTADNFIRTSGLIAMDSRGLIDYGNIDSITVEDNNYPYGIKTDYKKILSDIKKIEQNASLIVIDTGDLNRLSSYSRNLPYETYILHRLKIIQDIDTFIGELYSSINKDNSMLMVVSPNSPDDRIDSSKLSPIVIWQKDTYKGVMTSGTTRRSGIISNVDIAPTIANYLNSETQNFIGHSIRTEHENNSIKYLNDLNLRTNLISKYRVPLLTAYSVSVITVLIIVTVFTIFSDLKNRKVKNAIALMLLFLLIIPLAFILLSFIRAYDRATFILGFIVITLIIFLIIYSIKPKYRVLTISLSTLVILSIDITYGGNLIKYSILGYDPIIGARYFGIGNELVGAYLSAMVLSIALLLDKIRMHKAVILFLPIAVLIIAHPNLGANVGGTISILFASIILILLVFDIKINLKKTILIFLFIGTIIIIMSFVDIYINPNPSHLGKTLIKVAENGPVYLINVIIRKLQMNIKLIGNSMWSKVLFTCIIAILMFIKYNKETLRITLNNNRYLALGLMATLLGSIVGLLVNDSGVLLAAISCIYIATTLLYESLIIQRDNIKEVS